MVEMLGLGQQRSGTEGMAEAPLIQGLFAGQLVMLAIGSDGGISGPLLKGP
jgi:hypothetical protein